VHGNCGKRHGSCAYANRGTLAAGKANQGRGGGGLAWFAQGITPVSPSMAARATRLRPLPGRLRPLTAALRREAPCAGNPAPFNASQEFSHEHPRS